MSATTRSRLGLLAALVGGFVLAWTVLPARALKAEEAVSVALTEVAYATFAGGCFWCMEGPFDVLDGVISTTSGYAGGKEPSPTYEQVAGGRTSHAEVVQVAYDPARIGYSQLVDVFWRNVDPFAVNRQFCDGGPQYRSAILFHTDEQKQVAEASKVAMAERFGQAIATQIAPVGNSFSPAEDYHQDYYLKNPLRYKYYRNGCGRDRRLESIWGAQGG